MSNKLFYIDGKLVNNYNDACNIFILGRRRICSKKKNSNVNCGWVGGGRGGMRQ